MTIHIKNIFNPHTLMDNNIQQEKKKKDTKKDRTNFLDITVRALELTLLLSITRRIRSGSHGSTTAIISSLLASSGTLR